MREITNDEWETLILKFQENQFYGHTLSECLEKFIFDYAVLMEKAKNEERMEVDFQQDTNTKINNLWDYIYTLEKKLESLRFEFNNHKTHSVPSILYQPKPYYGPDPTMAGYKITAQDTDKVSFATSGYLQTVDFPTQEVDPSYKQKDTNTTNLTYTWKGMY